MEWFIPVGVLVMLGIAVFQNNRVNDSKVNRVFQRLDETKEKVGEAFVRKDVCEVQHKALNDKVDRIDKNIDTIVIKVDKLLIKNGIGD